MLLLWFLVNKYALLQRKLTIHIKDVGEIKQKYMQYFLYKKINCYCYCRTRQNYQLILEGLHLRINMTLLTQFSSWYAWQSEISWTIPLQWSTPALALHGVESPISRSNFQILYIFHWKKNYETISNSRNWKISRLDQVKIKGYFINKNILLVDTCITQGIEFWEYSM